MTIEFAVFVAYAEHILQGHLYQQTFRMFRDHGVLTVEADGDPQWGRFREFPESTMNHFHRVFRSKEDAPMLLASLSKEAHWAYRRPLELMLEYPEWECREYELVAKHGKLILEGGIT